ncbi:unnamed protein product [Adineta ricciae]|uniref:Uncharacterized protein n=1 Tax=Adineta ricciae TaxID=249248 RepID=A0A815FHJ9_ADIRI|nr:unnamed protein product [Adineta ricciae]CAF1340795.1 unnamed protein product [Adineta ricciae]
MTKIAINCINTDTQFKQDTVYFSNIKFRQTESYVLDVSLDGHFDFSSRFVARVLKVNQNRHVFVVGNNKTNTHVSILYLLTLTTNCSLYIVDDTRTTTKTNDHVRAFSMDILDDCYINTRILLTVTNPDLAFLLTANELNRFDLIGEKTHDVICGLNKTRKQF